MYPGLNRVTRPFITTWRQLRLSKPDYICHSMYMYYSKKVVNQVVKGFENSIKKLWWSKFTKHHHLLLSGPSLGRERSLPKVFGTYLIGFRKKVLIIVLTYSFHSSAFLLKQFTKPIFVFHYSENICDTSMTYVLYSICTINI